MNGSGSLPSDPTSNEGKVRPDSPYPRKKTRITERDSLRDEAIEQILKDQDGAPGKRRSTQRPRQRQVK